MKSQFQYLHQSDGSITLDGFPNVQLATVAAQGLVVGRNWQHELELPTYQEEWEQWARPVGMSLRHVRFIVMDQSESRLPGHRRLNPQAIVLPEQVPLELGHSGFLIGYVYSFVCGFDEMREMVPSLFNFQIPDPQPEGDFIVGTARLFDSRLSDVAWRGLQREIFSHVCPMVFMNEGAERLVQVTLTPGDFVGCPGARVLATWE